MAVARRPESGTMVLIIRSESPKSLTSSCLDSLQVQWTRKHENLYVA
jgi:hypothetical protein